MTWYTSQLHLLISVIGQFRATDTATEKDNFDLPTLFDILDDVMNSLPQERLQKLKEQRMKALAAGVAIPSVAAALSGVSLFSCRCSICAFSPLPFFNVIPLCILPLPDSWLLRW